MCRLRITGFLGAILELALFSGGSSLLHYYVNFQEIDIVSYYWVMFTILTEYGKLFLLHNIQHLWKHHRLFLTAVSMFR